MSDGPQHSSATLKLEARTSWRELLIRHLHAAVSTLGKTLREPMRTGACLIGIGIALALPSGLFSILSVLPSTDSSAGIGTLSLYLDPSYENAAAAQLGTQLRVDGRFERVQVISKEEALAEYETLSGLSNLTEILGENNPLPAILILTPRAETTGGGSYDSLVKSLASLPGVDLVEADLTWLHRLSAIRTLLQRIVLGICAVFGLGVLLIVASAVRLNIQEQSQHIELAKLIGATDAFVRRPFLYTGLWYGLYGAIFAIILVSAGLFALNEPIEQLAVLYDGRFNLAGVSLLMALLILAASVILGVCGAAIAVSIQLKRIEPQ